MRTFGYLFIGIFFGIVMYKSEAASWFRIYEMFQFQSFHMYGIMGSALLLGILGTQVIKKKRTNSFFGEPIKISPKEKGFTRYMVGGVIFGLGWALAGACPGPIYTLIGAGYVSIVIVFLAALLGAFIYGISRKNLPH
ncbi:YeeE/YedE thiosulfate transporter family protein [soil metagenome]